MPPKHIHKSQSPHQHTAHHNKLLSSVPTVSRNMAARRISEGESGRYKESLNCDTCGKGYKHISLLAKHLWEHTPEWNMTRKLLMLKHQQVQLLEAASILVGMNEPESGYATPASRSRRNTLQFSDTFSPLGSLELDSGMLSGNGRSHSISYYPPAQMLIPSTYQPMPGYVGGYFDVPRRDKVEEGTPEKELEEEKLGEKDDERKESDDDEIVGRME